MALAFYNKKNQVAHFSLFGVYAHLDGSTVNPSERKKAGEPVYDKSESARTAL